MMLPWLIKRRHLPQYLHHPWTFWVSTTLHYQINSQSQCHTSNMVRTYRKISCVWWFKSFTYNQHPIVDILCSSPTMNTCSKKRNIIIPDPMAHLDDDALDQQYFFALPSSLDPNDVVQLIQSDTISYDLADLEEEDFAEWKRMKEEESRARQMRRIREKAGVLKQLKRELRQAHKLSRMESSFPNIHWWHLKYWDIEGQVKKEEPASLTIVNIKVELPSTLHLLYPSQSPTTPSSRYRSQDLNDFENWGDLATA